MRTLLFFACVAVSSAGTALARQQDEPVQAEAGGQEEQRQPGAAAAGAEDEMDDAAGEDAGEETENETDEDEEELERFIPSEQVSRDLGVSFPADI